MAYKSVFIFKYILKLKRGYQRFDQRLLVVARKRKHVGRYLSYHVFLFVQINNILCTKQYTHMHRRTVEAKKSSRPRWCVMSKGPRAQIGPSRLELKTDPG